MVLASCSRGQPHDPTEVSRGLQLRAKVKLNFGTRVWARGPGPGAGARIGAPGAGHKARGLGPGRGSRQRHLPSALLLYIGRCMSFFWCCFPILASASQGCTWHPYLSASHKCRSHLLGHPRVGHRAEKPRRTTLVRSQRGPWPRHASPTTWQSERKVLPNCAKANLQRKPKWLAAGVAPCVKLAAKTLAASCWLKSRPNCRCCCY